MADFSISSRLTPPASVSDAPARAPLSWQQDRQNQKGKPRPAPPRSIGQISGEDDPKHHLDEEA